MATLLLIRHGIPEEYSAGVADMDRALTPEGWVQAHAVMQGLVGRGLRPHQGFQSPFRRAMETMACLHEAAGGFPLETSPDLEPLCPAEPAFLWLQSLLADAPPNHIVAVVSHEPFLGCLVHRFTHKPVDMGRASCSVLRHDQGRWQLVEHLRPADLGA
ncbi:MAG: histidine phosphatase family protein [Holophagaceae bacterium]